MKDLFIVSGVLESLKNNISKLEKTIMEELDQDNIDWDNISDLSYRIIEDAELLQEESEED